MHKKLCAVLLALALLAGHCAASATRIIFDDVPSTHWAFTYIQEAYLSHMVVGIGTDPQTGHMLFAPDRPIDAMSFTTLAANTFYAAETAETAGTTWFDAQYTVLLAHEAFNGLGVISLKDSIPRYQLVQVAYNILKDLGIHAPDHDSMEAAQAAIGDWDAIPAEAQEAAAAMYALGVISGTGDKFEPMHTTDRAQAVVICMKMKDLLDRELGEWNTPVPTESAEPSTSPAPSGSPEPTPSESPAPAESAEPSTSPEPSASPEPASSETPESSTSPEPASSEAPSETGTESGGTEDPATAEALPDQPPPKSSAPTDIYPVPLS